MRKISIITGSSTGIGAETAVMLAEIGHNVVINYSRNYTDAETTRLKCQAAGAEAILFKADVSDDYSCNAMVEMAVKRWGRLDALVNNAGITSFAGIDNWGALDTETFQRIYSVNALGAFQMIRACSKYLRESRGCVVNVSSAAGVVGRGSSVPYIMSKGALNSLTLYLARALAPEVRVNAVCPGMVTSKWFRDGLGVEGFIQLKEKFERDSPLRRASEPVDIAEAIVWLIEKAHSMTGELLLLDSGRHLG